MGFSLNRKLLEYFMVMNIGKLFPHNIINADIYLTIVSPLY